MALVPFPNKGRTPAPDEERDPDWDDSEHEDSAAGKMSFLDHLDELRQRIIYALLSVVVGFGIAFFLVDRIFEFVMTADAGGAAAGPDADLHGARPKRSCSI